MKQTIKYTGLLGVAVLALGAATSCNTAQRLRYAENRETANIRQVHGSAATDARYRTYTHNFQVNVDTAGSLRFVGKDQAGNNAYLLSEVLVSAKARTIPERKGQVNLDFMVRVPRKLQKYDWEILVLPNLDNGGRIGKLSPMLLTGKRFDWVDQRHRYYGLQYRDNRSAYSQDADYIYDHHFSRGGALRSDRMVDWYVDSLLSAGIGFRLDTVIRRANDIEYHYSNRLPVKNMANRLKIWFDARVTNLGYDNYIMAKSDTLYFNISSMLQFVDRTPRYITQTISRKVTDSLSANIQFHQGKYQVVEDLGNNRSELQKVRSRFEQLYRGDEFRIDSIAFTASCSPEGSWASNALLAHNRAKAIKDYFSSVFYMSDNPGWSLNERSIPEDWVHARQAVAKADFLQNRQGILSIMDAAMEADAKDRLIATTYPADYARMMKDIYPYLRAVDFQFFLSRKNMVQDTIVSSVMDTRYMDAIRMMDRRDYNGAKVILDQYKDWNTAICYMQMGLDRAAWDILNSWPDHTAEREYLLAILAERMGDRQLARTIFLKACDMDKSLVGRAYLDPEICNVIEYYDMHDELKRLAAE